MRTYGYVLAITILGLAACGDSGTTSSGSGGGGTGGATSASTGGAGGTSTSQGGAGQGGAADAVQPPTIDSVEPLEGGLHIMWTNVTTDCDMITFDRNVDGGAFASAFTVAGTADAYHDASATAPGTYCYVARCTRGSEVSSDSAEKCGTP
jgi:hypothetical protein